MLTTVFPESGSTEPCTSYASFHQEKQKSLANAKENAQQRCMFESTVRTQRRCFYTRQRAPDVTTGLARQYWLKIANFPLFLSFVALTLGNSFRIYGEASPIVKLESSRQPTVKIW